MTSTRRFPPPWQVEQTPGGFKVLDASGQALAYVYAREKNQAQQGCPENVKHELLGFVSCFENDARDTGLGPEHDFSSHAADAFGLMAIGYEDPVTLARFHRPINYPKVRIA